MNDFKKFENNVFSKLDIEQLEKLDKSGKIDIIADFLQDTASKMRELKNSKYEINLFIYKVYKDFWTLVSLFEEIDRDIKNGRRG